MAGLPVIMIVDDDEGVRKQLYWELNERFTVIQGSNADEGRKLLTKNIVDIALLDLHMPPNQNSTESGMSLLADICRLYPNTIPVIMTGDQNHSVSLDAVDQGAWDVFIKPVNPDELAFVLHRALRLRKLLHENELLKISVESGNEGDKMVGESVAMKALRETIQQIAPTDATVYISGESGTGKELVAEAIYRKSRRASKPFVAVNCAALSDSLIEDELFGHEAGAYTGSKGIRRGKFELADKGTIFLDEVAELSPAAQAKLLRILQEGTFERLGGERVSKVDVRVITATHQDLADKVKQGAFREDLFYRLNVIPVKVPALRERRDDIPLLANYFLIRFRQKMNRGPHAFSKAALDLLSQFDWKGNVRELRNLVERLVILVTSKTIQPDDLPVEYRQELPGGFQNLTGTGQLFNGSTEEGPLLNIQAGETYEDAVNRFRKSFIKQALAYYGTKTKAAEALGMNRSYLHELIDKLGISE